MPWHVVVWVQLQEMSNPPSKSKSDPVSPSRLYNSYAATRVQSTRCVAFTIGTPVMRAVRKGQSQLLTGLGAFDTAPTHTL